MKRLCGFFLILLMAAVVFQGCGVQSPEVPVVTEVTEAIGPVVVSGVDELLAALGSEMEVELAEGTYVLSDAADYGVSAEGRPYYWEPTEGGYQLVLREIRDMTLRGADRASVVLRTDAMYSDVLMLDGCADVCLESLSIGSGEPEGRGAALELYFCSGVTLKDLDISGSELAVLMISNSRRIALSGSEIHGASLYGIHVRNSDGMTVENCAFRDVGHRDYGESTVFRLEETRDVWVSGCEVSGNTVSSLIDCYPCGDVVFEKNTFRKNRVLSEALDVDGGLIFDDNIMEGNLIPQWFRSEHITVLDRIGKSWSEDMLEWYYNPPAEETATEEQEEIHVSTVDALLAAIGPDRRIVLDAPLYDLSTASDYGIGWTDYYYWTEEFDGPNLVITDVENMTICSAGGDVAGCTISAVPRYAHVLTFRDCSGITLSGFTAGHTVEPGYCMGGVLNFLSCDNILVDTCGLYGCGILGIQAERSGVLTVRNCDIYECSYGGMDLSEVSDVAIENCRFRDLGGSSMTFRDCKNVTVDGRAVSGNTIIN